MENLFKYILENNKKHIIFDFDKTLFKLIIDWGKYFEKIDSKLISVDKSIYSDYKNELINWCEMQNLYVERYGVSMEELICSNNINSELKLYKKSIPNKNLINLINNLDKYFLYIWSSNTRELITKILDQNNILTNFKKIVCRNDVQFLKPKPEGFLKLKNPNVSLKSYLLIGDSINDENAAKNIGIDFYKINFFD